MKKYKLRGAVVSTILVVLLQGSAQARNITGSDLRFFYITTGRTVDTYALNRYLRNQYDYAVRDDAVEAVFYLPESSDLVNPLIVHVGGKENNRASFEMLLERISDAAYAHDANPVKDLPAIIDYFKDGNDYLDESGKLSYERFTFHYIVHPDTDLQDGTIPKFFFTLGLQNLPEKRFQFRILHHHEDEFQYDASKPFGNWNFVTNYTILTYE